MAVWLNTAFAGFDRAVFEFFHLLQVSAGSFFTPFFKAITFLGEGGWFYIVVGVILLLFKRTRRLGVTMLIALAIGSLFTNLFIKTAISRPRPYTANDFYAECWNLVGATKTGKNSFPSGHTTAVFATTLSWVLCSKNKWRYTGFIFAILMASSRLYLFVHYATDIIGGIIVGSTMAVIFYFVIKKVFSVLESHTDNKVANFIINASVCDLFNKSKVE